MSESLFDVARRLECGKATHSEHPHYCRLFEQELKGYGRRKDLSVLELGVQHGGGLMLWRHMFPDARIEGLDIRRVAVEGFRCHAGSQSDPEVLEMLRGRGPWDIIDDDASHNSDDQQAAFHALWPAVSDGGVYIIEDLHCNYWRGFDGTPKTTEWLSGLCEAINWRAWNSRSKHSKRAQTARQDEVPSFWRTLDRFLIAPGIAFLWKRECHEMDAED